MTFREKSAWISLLCLLVIYGLYFWRVSAGSTHATALLVRAVITLIIVEAVLAAVIAGREPKQAQAHADEREQLIALKAARVGFYVLVVAALGVVGAMTAGISGPAAMSFLFLAVVLGEVAHQGGYIVYARNALR